MDTSGSFNNQDSISAMDDDQVIIDEFFDVDPLLSEVLSCYDPSSLPLLIHQNNNNNNMNEQIQQLPMNSTTSLNLSEGCIVSHEMKEALPAFPSPQIIDFGSSSASPISDLENYHDDRGYNGMNSRTSPIKRSPRQALYHVVAERKRRENLSDLFIALSKVIPGLTKLDKASVLEDAIKHMHELQQRLKILEDANRELKRCTTSSIKSTCNDDDGTIRGKNRPDIKVKTMGKNVLIKVLCEKRYQGFISKMSKELQKLHLRILDTRVLEFGGFAIDITFAAQMESQFSTPPDGIVESLQMANMISRSLSESLS